MSRKKSPPSFKLHLLGSFRLENEHGELRLPTRKIESLLAYLVLHPEEHAREKLAALFWGDSTDTQARDSLRTALKNLRKQFGADLLLADRDTIQLNPTFPLWVDAKEFQQIADSKWQMANDTSDISHRRQSSAIATAISYYRGDLLSDFYDDWILPEREHYRTLYLETLFQLTQEFRAHGDYPSAIEHARKILTADPTHERAHQQLMSLYLATGDRTAALKQYEECVRVLRQELDIEPSPETTALYQEIKAKQSSTKSAPRLTNVPIPLTSFIGRQKEIEQINEILTHHRLVTLTGAGGSGKTRLAIKVATTQLDAYPDGVWWVELAALNDPALVPSAIAQVLNVREVPNQPMRETLAHHLRTKQLLLALDNCEHLITACAELAEFLLTSCPHLKILATSREPLAIPGEHIYQVPTLDLPQSLEMPVHQVLNHEATLLFVERANAAKANFTLDEANTRAIAQICQRLDGIPLAIELAAARVQILSPTEIAARLDDRFSLLTHGSRTALPRHQTLRATIDWSYNLLTEPERILFRRLSVFAGGFTLEAVSAICAGADIDAASVLDALSHLVDKSLVIVDRQAVESRYRLLETLREYAHEKLGEAHEAEIISDRHLEFFANLAEEAEHHLFSAGQPLWFERLEIDRDNLRAAIDWSLASEHSTSGLRLMAALWFFWFSRGPLGEAHDRLKLGLEQPSATARTAIRARALNAIGILNSGEINQSDLRPRLEEALAIGRELDDKTIIAASLRNLGLSAHLEGDYANARVFLEESLAVGREFNPSEGPRNSQTLLFLGDVFLNQGDSERAKLLYEESIVILREIKDKNFLAYALRRLGQLAVDQQDLAHALDLCKQSLALNLEIRDLRGVIACLAAIAEIFLLQEQFPPAAQLLGATSILINTVGLQLLRIDEVRYERNLARLREQLNETTFFQEWTQGEKMTLEQAVEFARQPNFP